MIFKRNSCWFGCVIVSSLVVLNNFVLVFAIAKSNVNQLNAANGVTSLPHWRLARDVHQTDIANIPNPAEISIAVTPERRVRDDRLYFELPDWFKSINDTDTPSRLNTDTVTDAPLRSSSSKPNNSITVGGAYNFSVRLEDGTIHAERGDYEFRNGKRVFVIRGYFRNVAATDKPQVTSSPYIFDHTGFHSLPDYPPPSVDDGAIIPDSGCVDCIDPKLLELLVA